jgi:thiol-disulfide isomerase/thioredoxin
MVGDTIVKKLQVATGILALSVLMAGCSSSESKQDTANTATTVATTVNPQAALLQFTAKDVEGNLRNSSEWIGKQPVIINFWGTWCGPCRREIPELVKLYAEYKDKGIEIVSLAVRDTPEKVIKFTAQNDMNWVMLMATQEVSRKYGVTGVPTTVFFNRKGEPVNRFVGPRPYAVFKEQFEAILR